MRLLEYEGKELFSSYGIKVPRSRLAMDAREAAAAAREIGFPAVIKAQVLSGGRGKAGGVVVVQTPEAAASEAGRILNLRVAGEPTRSLLVEESVDHVEELYLSVSLQRERRTFVALASRSGGMEVEASARGAMLELPVPLEGLSPEACRDFSGRLGLDGPVGSELSGVLERLERLAREKEAELAEVNPLALLRDGTFIALDSKLVLDDNALFRHPEFSRLPPEDPLEEVASRSGFAFVRLDGDIGVVGNGAGLVMSTLDLVADSGGRPACFLDLGGGAQRERMEAAIRLVLRMPGVRSVLVNIFGGITETVDMAEGIKDAASGGGIPVFARMRGQDEEEAWGILESSGIPVFARSEQAVEAAVRGAAP